MSPPWMPLYIADYLRDTTHLQAAESGAYLHLIMAYWAGGKLPNDDRQLATIARMTSSQWRRTRPIVEPFFGSGFGSHKRIDRELARAAEVSASYAERASQAAKKRWSKHALSNASSIPSAMLGDAHSQPHTHTSEPKGSAPDVQEAELFTRGKQVLGTSAGGLIAKLKAHHGSVAKARATIETASTKQDPREWVNRVLRGRQDDGFFAATGAIV